MLEKTEVKERRDALSGSNFIMIVIMILILLFILMAIGPLFSVGP